MDITRRQILIGSTVSAALAALTACSSERGGTPPADPTTGADTGTAPAPEGTEEQAPAEDILIGIAMPTKSLERWNRDGAHLETLLQEKGFRTSLQYADNKQDQQNNQVQNMINDGAQVVVIASIDGTALGPVLQQAADRGVAVLAYDRLINGSEHVDYYATFDNYKVGQLQGQFILDNLEDHRGEDGTVNLEPFAGSPDDNNARYFFAGAWELVSPLIDSGEITVPSGKAPADLEGWTGIGIPGWKSETAQAEIENRLNSFYTGGKKVNVVLSPNDSLALGIQQGLDGAGYTPEVDWPLVTGQDADLANVKNMLIGKQAMTVWKDTRRLGDQVAVMIEQIIAGTEVEVNDTETYDNGVKVVPTYMVEPEVVTPDTVEEKLVESGFYTAEDLGL